MPDHGRVELTVLPCGDRALLVEVADGAGGLVDHRVLAQQVEGGDLPAGGRHARRRVLDDRPQPGRELTARRIAGPSRGEPFDGRFKTFTATVSHDPANVAATKISADIDVASVDTQNAERDETLAGAAFFDFKRFPTAKFSASAWSAPTTSISSAAGCSASPSAWS